MQSYLSGASSSKHVSADLWLGSAETCTFLPVVNAINSGQMYAKWVVVLLTRPGGIWE